MANCATKSPKLNIFHFFVVLHPFVMDAIFLFIMALQTLQICNDLRFVVSRIYLYTINQPIERQTAIITKAT